MQLLHWVFKVGDLRGTMRFYERVLRMRILRHEEFGSECDAQCNGPYARPWSKTMVGYGPEDSHFVFELTYNYGISKYAQGHDFAYALVGCADRQGLFARAKSEGFVVDEVEGVVVDPCGYRFKIVDHASDFVFGVALYVDTLETAADYYVKHLGMSVRESSAQSIVLSAGASPLQLQLVKSDKPVDHAKAYGRLAMAVEGETLLQKQEALLEAGERIQTPFVSLETPGKATVQVVIVLDREGYEICLVGQAGFFELCKPEEGAAIDWETRIANGSKDPKE